MKSKDQCLLLPECGLVFFPSQSFVNKDHTKEYPLKKIRLFLSEVLEEFLVNVQQHLLICGIDNE